MKAKKIGKRIFLKNPTRKQLLKAMNDASAGDVIVVAVKTKEKKPSKESEKG